MERKESLEIDPHIYQHISYDQLGIVDQWVRVGSSITAAGILDYTYGTGEWNWNFTSHHTLKPAPGRLKTYKTFY